MDRMYREENHMERECMRCTHHEINQTKYVGLAIHNAPTFDEKYGANYRRITNDSR